ncbi:hypothetical protein I6F50_15555 [Pseudoalteromonas sp. NZS127_1]|jgi:uncharacterized protein YceK|uniref:Lipoprotein n=2 Tax=Pseudoalteromonas arctica TaxID=394751 RepID=A0A290S7S5_9GAMM|nr:MULTISPECIES: hypothetical protein [Pseudoalteromonas]ATC88123.1 hypothetical protein PARC_a3795 [Pseudoalteromonas arctica A 37-1-2]EGI73812.1 hypothetical protein PH505_an00920 [Pseudoalteromonas distincta]MBG9996473.1 hypothetical protein [Pseudoalteromonas sp. NZS127_1]MBH0013116.1 hypothetical protein [Pseudoalteromonas sp. NZS100_1]MBH0017702.1 hypothetical protein [Pseudoalteromonas sp. NGC95]
MAKLLLPLATLLALGGCQSVDSEPAKPAILTSVNPSVITTLQQAIQQAKGGTLVTLADSVFTKRSELLIDHAMSKGSDGRVIMGAHNIKSEKFILQLRNNQCELYYPKKELTTVLEGVTCKEL